MLLYTSMSFLFGGRVDTPQNPTKVMQRDVRLAVRKLERDEVQAEKQGVASLAKIKGLATQGKLEQCQSQARDLVRLRHHTRVLGQMKSQLTGLSQKLAVAESTGTIQATLARTSKLLAGLNKHLSPKEMQKVLMDFQKQNTVFTDGQEILNETLDEAFEADDELSNVDSEVTKVMDEIGIERGAFPSLMAARGVSLPAVEDDLAKRLESLKSL